MTAAWNTLAGWRACVWLAVGAVVGAGSGCASAPAPRTAEPSAQLAIANLTGYRWRVTLRNGSEGASRELRIAPHERVAIEVRAGGYVIAQEAEGPAEIAGARTFTAEFARGERYEWALATVRSMTEGASGPR